MSNTNKKVTTTNDLHWVHMPSLNKYAASGTRYGGMYLTNEEERLYKTHGLKLLRKYVSDKKLADRANYMRLFYKSKGLVILCEQE